MDQPSFPPLLSGHRVDRESDLLAEAVAGARDSSFEAGDLLWAEDDDRLRFALVLRPEVPVIRCREILFVTLVAFGDSAGALCPPEIPISYRWPSSVLMNGALIGHADLVLPETKPNDVPDWMVVSLDMRVRPDESVVDPGLDVERTTMWDEGGGDVTALALLESTSRHIVNALHNWEEDGFRPIYDQWHARLDTERSLAQDAVEAQDLSFVGMDDNCDAIVSSAGGSDTLPLEDALSASRAA